MPDCAVHKTHGWFAPFRRRIRRAPAYAAGLGILLAAPTLLAEPAHAQAPRQSAPQAGDADLERARRAFESLDEAGRKSIQSGLIWSGDYPGSATGTFGRLTFEAIRAFQRRAGYAPTGIVDARTGKKLAEDEIAARLEAGFSAVTDPSTGVALWAPMKVLTKRGSNPNGGSRFQSADDRVTLDTRALPGGEAELKELFERNLAIQTPGRAVTYRLHRPDFFVIAGETPSGKFYSRFAAGPPGIRGFSIGYDKALAPRLDRMVVAIANDFEPFPIGSTVAAAPTSPAPPPRELAANPRPVPSFTGIVVGPRRVVTAAAIEGCPEPQVAGTRARVARVDAARGLAVLDLSADRRAPSLPLAEGAPTGADAVTVLFVPAGESRAVATRGELAADGRIVSPLQDGAAIALVVDRGGAVAGVVVRPSLGPRVVAGLAPPASHPVTPASGLRDLWGAPSARSAEPRSLGGLAAELAPAVVPVTCAPVARPGR